MTANADGTAVLSGTPGPDDIGEHVVVLQVSDEAGATRQQSFTIRVTRVNHAPVFSSKPVIDATESATYSYPIATVDRDDPLSRFQARLPNVSINTGISEPELAQVETTDQQSTDR